MHLNTICTTHKASAFIAFKASIAVLIGYLVMGVAWGIVAFIAKFDLFETFLSALLIFSGSLQFLLISMLQAGLGLEEIIFAAALLNSRYFFM